MYLNSQPTWLKNLNGGSFYLFGFTFWKYFQIKHFFARCQKQGLFFCKNFRQAVEHGIDEESVFCIWGLKKFEEVEEYARRHKIKTFRIEDGFIRSIASNSAFPKIYSIVMDSRGIYFDPSKESDLEYLFNNFNFDSEIRKYARQIINKLKEFQISKYNYQPEVSITIEKHRYNKIILVVGQIETGWSVIFGGCGVTILEMVKKIRKENEKAFVIYKVPPDLSPSNKMIPEIEKSMSRYVDKFIYDASIISCINVADEVHTLTSLAGFEALLRGKKVYTYGLPFYSGWGLTEDMQFTSRRKRKLTVEELVAGSLILYPIYINPRRKTFCEVNEFIDELYKSKLKFNSNKIRNYYLKAKMFLIPKLPGYKL